MLIDFNGQKAQAMPGMNHGTGEMSAKMFIGDAGKIIPCRLHKGGSIGMHSHPTSDDINFILSSVGKAICDGEEEPLAAGNCHVCKKGSMHSIVNTGEEDLVLLTVVVER